MSSQSFEKPQSLGTAPSLPVAETIPSWNFGPALGVRGLATGPASDMRYFITATLLGATWNGLIAKSGVGVCLPPVASAPDAKPTKSKRLTMPNDWPLRKGPAKPRRSRRTSGRRLTAAKTTSAHSSPPWLDFTGCRLGGLEVAWSFIPGLRRSTGWLTPAVLESAAMARAASRTQVCSDPTPHDTAMRQKSRTLVRITAIRSEGEPSVEGWASALDFADMADAVWRSTCPASA